MPSNTYEARLQRIRRKAARQQEVIQKVREDSRWYTQYGPFMILDVSNSMVGAIIASGLDLDGLEQEYAKAKAQR